MIRIALPAFLLSASVAMAADPGAMFLASWDQNRDGSVSLTEARAGRAEIFTAFDSNSDDIWQASELEDMRATLKDASKGVGLRPKSGKAKGMKSGAMSGLGEGFADQGMDSDGDGIITRAEFESSTEAWFARRDRNGDKQITADDFKS